MMHQYIKIYQKKIQKQDKKTPMMMNEEKMGISKDENMDGMIRMDYNTEELNINDYMDLEEW